MGWAQKARLFCYLNDFCLNGFYLMSVSDRIAHLIEPTLTGMGYELVRVALTGTKKAQVLQIMADRADGAAITVDDCEAISHTISAQLDVSDPIASAYTLEVSSPGIDRPLTRLKDFARFAGFEAKLQLREALEGQRNFSGLLRGVKGEEIAIDIPPAKGGKSGLVHLPFAAIDHAKLVMSEALLHAARKGEINS